MNTKTAYKLMRKDMTTYNGYQWVMGAWREANGQGDLCDPGWLHAYATPTIAAFHNPIHADMPLDDCLLMVMECEGKFRDDRGLKCGFTRMRPVREIPLVIPTTEQAVTYGIYCSLTSPQSPEYLTWARTWLSGVDRSARAAWAAAEAAEAARAAAETAAWAAAEAAWAAWAAEAAARAAWAATRAAWAATRAAACLPFEEFALAAMSGTIPASLSEVLSGVEVAK